MTSSARGWSDNPGGDEVGESIIGRVERAKFGNRTTPIRDDHFFTALHAVDVLAQPILKVADPDLRPRSSYFHASIVATNAEQSWRPPVRKAGSDQQPFVDGYEPQAGRASLTKPR